MAHIGVIKVMEKAGLRPDMISSVTMGSIVGGLYAIGYSSDSLEKIVRDIDWSLILSDKIPVIINTPILNIYCRIRPDCCRYKFNK